mgnify:CR=1 FL=1
MKILLMAAAWATFVCTAFAGPQTRLLLEAMNNAPAVKIWPIPRTYSEARQQAIDRNLPLVVWSGAGL